MLTHPFRYCMGSRNMLDRLASLIADFSERAAFGVGIAAVAVLTVMIATREAEGSCGDYLVIGAADHAMDQSGGATRADTSRMPVSFPCEGPQCRQSPNIPVPPVPAAAGPSSDELALVRRLADIDLRCPLSYRVVDASTRLPPGYPFRLERPPRA